MNLINGNFSEHAVKSDERHGSKNISTRIVRVIDVKIDMKDIFVNDIELQVLHRFAELCKKLVLDN